MSEQQYRIWGRMIKTIENFEAGIIQLHELVPVLEPPMDAAPIDDKNILKKWYELWSPLEIKNAIYMEENREASLLDIKHDIEKIKKFMKDNHENVKSL